MKTYSLITPTQSTFGQALRANKPLENPLAQAEKWVLCVLMKSQQGKEPDAAMREFILAIAKADRSQWARIAAANPEKAEIMAAINNFFYGNLIERCSAAGCKQVVNS